MPPSKDNGPHRHKAGALSQSNKAFKSRHATKTQLRDKAKGKVTGAHVSIKRRPLVGAQSKADRRNAARLEQHRKRQSLLVNSRLFAGRHGVPKVCLILPLCDDSSAEALLRLCWEAEDRILTPPAPIEGRSLCSHTLEIPRHKQALQFITPPATDFLALLDAAKVADFVLPLLSATHEAPPFAERLLRSIQAQGSPSILPVVQGLEQIPTKKHADIKRSLGSFISYFFPESAKPQECASTADASLLLRSLCGNVPRPPNWSHEHAYLLADDIAFTPSSSDPSSGTLIVTGYARGGGHFSANRLVHIPNFGDFQIDHIASAPLPSESSAPFTPSTLDTPDPEKRDDLQTENVPDFMENEQTWPTEEEMAEGERHMRDLNEEEEGTDGPKRRLPKGTSNYQAAWICDEDVDASDLSSSDDEEEEEGDAMEEDGDNRSTAAIHTDNEGGSDNDDEDNDMLGDEEEARQLQEHLHARRLARAEQDDLEFPDEIDTPLDMSARTRFQRYRGLESFKKSPWDPYENLPMDYARIFQFENWRQTAHRVVRAAAEGLSTGSRVSLHLSTVPASVVSPLTAGFNPARPFPVYGLLQYENKMSLLNFSVSRDSEFNGSVRSKDPLILQCGFRRYLIHPLFSAHSQRGPNNVHKFERFLRPGAISVATIYGPVHFGHLPVTLFRQEAGSSELALVGTGRFLSVDPKRIIAKRIVLTGYPFKINTRSAVIRYMFHSREDIEWFKPVKVATKYGKVGHIREALGTHGYMKVQFDGPIKQQDTVCMNLYKRVFPKWNTSLWREPSSSPL